MPDSEEKRKSVVGIVTPNASKDEDWRRQVAGVYSLVGDEEPPTPGGAVSSSSGSSLFASVSSSTLFVGF